MYKHDYKYEPDYDVIAFGSPRYRNVFYTYDRNSPATEQDKFINWFTDNFNNCEIKIIYEDDRQVNFRFMNEDEYHIFKFYVTCKQTKS